jgi:hypothetical protein
MATRSQSINNNLTTVWTCCRHFPCRGGWGNVVPTSTDSSHPASAGTLFTLLAAVTPPLQPRILPTASEQFFHSAPRCSARAVDENESTILSPFSQRAAITNPFHPERAALGENSSPGHATLEAVAISNLQDIRFLEFPEGAREWWTRMTNGAVNESRKLTSSSTMGESR